MASSSEVLPDQLSLAEIPELIDLLTASQKVRLVIEGWSMYPALKPGDTVTLDPARKESLEVGDIVAFRREGKLICHRLVGLLQTRGDALAHDDPSISKEDVLGKVLSVERRGKSWIPSREILRPSFGDRVILLLQTGATRVRFLLLFFQSFHWFRILYRSLLRPKCSWRVGIPVPSHFPPRFWRYLDAETEIYLQEACDEASYRFLAKRKERVVGSLEISTSEKNSPLWSISHLFVKTRYRGCGIATQLLHYSLQVLRRRNEYSLLKAETPLHNHPAFSFFKRLGFSVLSEKGPIVFQKEPPLSIHSQRHEESFIQQVGWQLILEETLFEIDTAFKEQGVDYLVLKGMALAYLLYPDPATRPMTDIDLYLRKQDIPLAATALKRLGYTMHEEDFEKELSAFSGEFAFHKTGHPLVELHTSLEQYERLKGMIWIDEEALWKRAIPYSIAGKTFKALCPEHQLFALSIHLGLMHRFQGFKWFLDIDRLIMTFGKTLNWEELLQAAKKWKVERIVGEVLLSTQELFNTPLPPLSFKRRALFMRKTAFQWLLMDRPQDRVRVLFRALFPSRAWLIYRYRLRKRSRALLYRFLHPLFVIVGKTK